MMYSTYIVLNQKNVDHYYAIMHNFLQAIIGVNMYMMAANKYRLVG